MVCFGLHEHLFIRVIKNAEMYFRGTFKNAPVIVFKIFQKPQSSKQECAVDEFYPCIFITLFLPQGKIPCLSGGQKNDKMPLPLSIGLFHLYQMFAIPCYHLQDLGQV